MKRYDVSADTLELIRITELCQAFGQLPQAGGVLDQDFLLIQGMSIVMQIKSEKQEKDQNAARR
jgi:hypothetical protein